MGMTIAVISPISAIASPLTAPSTAPVSMALEVPSPCAEHPRARPRDTGLPILNILRNTGPATAPMNPHRTTETAVSYTLPPSDAERSMAIGVVTDLGSSDFTKISSRAKILHSR